MKIVRNKIRLDKRYITEALDTESLGKIIILWKCRNCS